MAVRCLSSLVGPFVCVSFLIDHDQLARLKNNDQDVRMVGRTDGRVVNVANIGVPFFPFERVGHKRAMILPDRSMFCCYM